MKPLLGDFLKMSIIDSLCKMPATLHTLHTFFNFDARMPPHVGVNSPWAGRRRPGGTPHSYQPTEIEPAWENRCALCHEKTLQKCNYFFINTQKRNMEKSQWHIKSDQQHGI
jgi:hypothetical protein